MTAATESELSKLHSMVAKNLIKQLEDRDKAKDLIDITLDIKDLPKEVQDWIQETRLHLIKMTRVSPALIGVITKFLKDNDITAVIEESPEMSDLEQRLAQKKARKIVGNVIPIKDDE